MSNYQASPLNALLRKIAPNGKAYSARGNHQNLTTEFVRRKFATYPYAVLGLDNQVIVVRNYQEIQISHSLFKPIPDGLPVKPGWTWTGSSFQPPAPE